MRRLPALLLTVTLLSATYSCICNPSEEEPAPACDPPATIRDLTGRDGCGFVLVLDNGQRLQPHGTLWQEYAKHDGERVTISYAVSPAASGCPAGKSVELKCLQQQNGFSATKLASN